MKNLKLLQETTNYHEELIEALKDPQESCAYLQVALEEYLNDGNTELLLVALRNVAEAKGGLSKLAKKTHLNRQSLYKTLSKHGNPRIDTFGLILKGLGFKLVVHSLAIDEAESII